METPRIPSASFTEDELVKGQLQAWDLINGFVASFTVKAACLLRIPDILATHGPLTPTQIASHLGSNNPNIDYLSRILRFLCAKGVFSLSTVDTGASEPSYGPTPISACLLLQDRTDLSLGPMALLHLSPMFHAPWQRLSDCVLHGGVPFDSVHGMDVWSFLSCNPDNSQMLNDAMASSAAIEMKAILKNYRGFESLKTIVDVGGGIGRNIAQIVARYPNIKAINFDLPHVVATAPRFQGVEQLGGDMFDSIPSADAILMKSIMHDWDDENCIKILKNCRKALPESGKVIIIDSVLETDEGQASPFNRVRMGMDLVMLVIQSGKERTRKNWEDVFAAAGFPRFSTIELPCIQYVIEAFPAALP